MSKLKSVNIYLFNGIISENIFFNPHLNILAGENGTCKTNILKEIKNNRNLILDNPGKPIRTQAISPKRNSERKAFQTIIQQFKQQNRNFDSYLQERLSSHINDNTFDNYPSLGDLFYLSYEKECRTGGEQTQYMTKVTDDFNKIIKTVFENYELQSVWDKTNGIPSLKLKKNGINELPIESLSTGEQEVLSLILNIFSSKDGVDLYLIDEPEVHLNWHLEERLFSFLNEFTKQYDKQAIIATHSRTIFQEPYLQNCQFLHWEGQKITVKKNISALHKKRLAGEALEIIKLGDFSKPTFFVEDSSHKKIIKQIADTLDKEIIISEAGNSPNVKSIYSLSKKEGGWEKAYFVVDGDNMGNPFPNETNFIHLNKYCIENYLLSFTTLQSMFNKTENEIKEIILSTIKEKKENILKKNKYFEFLIDRLTIDDINEESLGKLDASELVESIIVKLGAKYDESFIKQYVEKGKEIVSLENIFPQVLIDSINS